jgi:hypothetical protein
MYHILFSCPKFVPVNGFHSNSGRNLSLNYHGRIHFEAHWVPETIAAGGKIGQGVTSTTVTLLV